MKTRTLVALSLALPLAALAPFALSSQDPPAATSVEALDWLAGGWELEQDGAQVEEHWIAPKGGCLLGVGRTITQGKTVFFEFLRIEQRKDGLFYVAHPAARSPGTDFVLTSAKDGAWTFENPGHDFPKLIRYTREANGGLTAHLEAVEHGQPAAQDFHYTRIER